jgi:hypothetical protein
MRQRKTHELVRGFRLYAPGERGKNVSWVARGQHRGKQIERCLWSTNYDTALKNLDVFLEADPRLEAVDPQFTMEDGDRLPRWAVRLLDGARYRSSVTGIPFSLTRTDMARLVIRARGRCEVTNLPFTEECIGGRFGRRRPYVPSLDRINPARGYVAGNCRLVTFAANVAMSDWGLEAFRRLARSFLADEVREKLGE